MNRPTCGTCPYNVRGACYLSPAEWQDQGRGPPVADDRPGCQHHPDMGAWLAQRQTHGAQPQRGQHAHVGAPTWQQARERLERQAQSGQQQAAAPEQLAELEQWRRAIVWRSAGFGEWALCWTSTGAAEISVMGDSDGMWHICRGTGRYYSRDAAFRAAEAALGLPKCRVDGEP